MKTEDFIKLQVSKIKQNFSLYQIRDEVQVWGFREFIGIYKIDTIINNCMEIYAEIIKQSNEQAKTIP